MAGEADTPGKDQAYRRSGVSHPGFLQPSFGRIQIQTLDLQQLPLFLRTEHKRLVRAELTVILGFR